MKVILPVLGAGLLLGGPLLAIPQTIAGVQAPGNGGSVTLEEWFRDAGHWQADAELPGVWSRPSASQPSTLGEPGVVFGVKASRASVLRDASGVITTVQVFFDSGTAKVGAAGLLKRLQKAVAIFTGVDGRAAGYTVVLSEPGPGAVTATFTR